MSEGEAIKKLKARVRFLEEQQGNRWAAFTNDELHAIAYPTDDPGPTMSHLIYEVDAELERRKP